MGPPWRKNCTSPGPEFIWKGPCTPELFVAWTDGRRWNGWATLNFEKGEADRVMSAFNVKSGATVAHYDRRRDVYVFVDQDLDPPQEGFGLVEVDGKKLYPIGTAIWCWSSEDDLSD